MLQALAEHGHTLSDNVVTGSSRSLFGRAQIIRVEDAETGVLCAGSDGRADGCAIPLLAAANTPPNAPPAAPQQQQQQQQTIPPAPASGAAPTAAAAARKQSIVPALQRESAPPTQTLQGEIFLYKRSLAAVLSLGGHRSFRGLVVFVPGLTDGLLGVSYVSALATAANRAGFAFVQPTLSSSYRGYGTSSLDKDVEELDSLIGCQRIQGLLPNKSRNIVIVGHSTGCQDAVHYVKHGTHKERISMIVLQAPVSDREAMLLEAAAITSRASGSDKELDGFEQLIQALEFARAHATSPDASKHNTLMPHDSVFTYGTPVTCSRFHSLGARMTPEDMFSTDLTVQEMTAQVGHVAIQAGVKSMLVFSGADEYVSEELKADYAAFARKMAAAMGGVTAGGTGMCASKAEEATAGGAPGGRGTFWSSWHVLKGASHGLDGAEHAEAFVRLVSSALA